MIISLGEKNNIYENLISLHDKSPGTQWNIREISRNNRGDKHSKATTNIKLNRKKLQVLPKKSGTRHGYPHYTYSI